MTVVTRLRNTADDASWGAVLQVLVRRQRYVFLHKLARYEVTPPLPLLTAAQRDELLAMEDELELDTILLFRRFVAWQMGRLYGADAARRGYLGTSLAWGRLRCEEEEDDDDDDGAAAGSDRLSRDSGETASSGPQSPSGPLSPRGSSVNPRMRPLQQRTSHAALQLEPRSSSAPPPPPPPPARRDDAAQHVAAARRGDERRRPRARQHRRRPPRIAAARPSLARKAQRRPARRR